MAQGEMPITLVGNLTADPELRFTPAGAAVSNFTVATNPRVYDKQSGEWRDGDAVFMRCNVWRQQAENVAESLTRGQQVIVFGRLRQRSFETREGDKRTVVEVEVDNVGPGLQWSVAQVSKAARGGGQRDGGQQRGGQYDDGEQWASQRQRSGGGQQREQYDDPWGSAPPAGDSRGQYDDEPPF